MFKDLLAKGATMLLSVIVARLDLLSIAFQSGLWPDGLFPWYTNITPCLFLRTDLFE